MNQREIFLNHVAQTSASPIGLEIIRAEGCTLSDAGGKQYLDLIGGISVANTGHRHPKVIAAIQSQLDAYLHIMVYGEFIQSPQVQYAQLLTGHLPSNLQSVYFTNSGAEATEGAMKLAKRTTNRSGIIAFNNSYHGSTQGALSVIGSEYWRNAFRPLLPGITHLEFNNLAALEAINEQTACVIAETIQAESGVVAPAIEWMKALRKRCSETGALLILDEIQAGFGRTGKLWGFEHDEIVPDILLLGKAMGGGMPLGAFVADRTRMNELTRNPELGHITTFGGHPVSCVAGMASMNALLEEKLMDTVDEKTSCFLSFLDHPKIRSVRSKGLWIALEFDSFEINKKVIDACIRRGVLTDWFLFAPQCLRICPPLSISQEEIAKACEIIMQSIREV